MGTREIFHSFSLLVEIEEHVSHGFVNWDYIGCRDNFTSSIGKQEKQHEYIFLYDNIYKNINFINALN